jgi:uncharacterized SAM-binding protein YcdF (DUF218 family)
MRDYAIIFGAAVRNGIPSLTLQNRIQGTLAWARDNPDAMFIPTGAMGVEGHVEAYVIERALIHGGIARERIIAEPKGRDTLESVRYCDAILRKQGDCRAVACCTSTYHQPRCALLLRLLGYRVIVPPMPNGLKRLSKRAYARSIAKEVLGTPYDASLLLARRISRRV